MTGFNTTLSRSLGPNFGTASREMDDLFNRLFHTNGDSASRQWMSPVSIWEEGDRFHLELEAPGVSADNIDLTFEDGRLKVSVQRMQSDDDSRKYLHNERYWGEFTRTISIPESVDPESIEADYTHGVLHVQFAKRPEVMPRKIEITTR